MRTIPCACPDSATPGKCYRGVEWDGRTLTITQKGFSVAAVELDEDARRLLSGLLVSGIPQDATTGESAFGERCKHYGLTRRESEAARLVCAEHDAVHAARLLNISKSGFDSCLTRVYKKLGVRGRVGAAILLTGGDLPAER